MGGNQRDPQFRFTCASGDTDTRRDAFFLLAFIHSRFLHCILGRIKLRRGILSAGNVGQHGSRSKAIGVLALDRLSTGGGGVHKHIETFKKVCRSLIPPLPPSSPKECFQEQHPDLAGDWADACWETFRRAMLVEAGLSSERKQKTKYEWCACMARAWTTKHIRGNRAALLGVGTGVQ